MKAAAAAFLEEIGYAVCFANVPPWRHRDGSACAICLPSLQQAFGLQPEQHRLGSQLVLQESAEATCRADQPTKSWAIEVVAVQPQPVSLVATHELAVDDEPFHQIHQRIFLEIAVGMTGLVGDDKVHFLRREPQRLEDIPSDIGWIRLTRYLLDYLAEKPVTNIGVGKLAARLKRKIRVLAQNRSKCLSKCTHRRGIGFGTPDV
jgi:hypothetical protein